MVTSRDSPSTCSKEATPSPSTICTPFRRIRSAAIRPNSGSNGANTWSAISITVVSKPAWARFSAVSNPMNPPPTTTACFAGFTVWNPEYTSIPVRKLVPRAIHSRIARASGTVRTSKIPGRSIPGIGGRTVAAPGESTSAS